MEKTFGSTCHGAGRAMSREAAKRFTAGRSLQRELEDKGIAVRSVGRWTLAEESSEASHGGTDYLELKQFVKAVRNKTQTPIDVYDSVIMSVIIPLAEQSIANGSAPVECPDFTRGKWKTKKPTFAI